MNLLPKASGTRPRVAAEIFPQGVVAARSADAVTPLAAVAKADLAEGAVVPSLKPGNLVDRVAVTAALRQAMEGIGSRSNMRGADMTLIIPDASVRVLLLDFDALPHKLSEALPIVRFRLKKLLPFDADEAMVTFQIMSSSKTAIRVLAVAIPRDVLSEYETAAREAGFEPGAVLPSTLAALAGIDDPDNAALLVNASPGSVTTAIVRGSVLMLHRSVDLQEHASASPANVPPALLEPSAVSLPLVDREHSAAEWSAQQPVPEHGRNPYADRAQDEAAVQDQGGITAWQTPPVFATDSSVTAKFYPGVEPLSPSPSRTGLCGNSVPVNAEEIAQAVSVAAAYFEDNLNVVPSRVLSAGPLGAGNLGQILREKGVAQTDGLHVRELVETSALLSDAVTSSVPRGWLSGVLGALRG